MKKILFFLVMVFITGNIRSQGNADCMNSQPLCANPSFSFFTVPAPSYGNIDELTNPSISNPNVNPASGNGGCLLTNENNPQWLVITIGNAGMLEFVFGAANSPNPQAGFYDWAMWPYSPTACSQILNNTLPPVRCNWNGPGSGGTGIASPSNIPMGGSASNYEPPLAVNACQQFVICISNYSNINTLVSFQTLGTASLSCNPNCNPDYVICAGSSATIVPVNFANLGNPTYSLQPGGLVSGTPSFVVSPSVTTTYTTYITGTGIGGAVVTTTAVSIVTVNPMPVIAPTSTQATCANTVNAVDLGLSFYPSSPVPNYTVTWNPVPPGVISPTQTSATGLPVGLTNVTVTAAGGCKVITSFSMLPVPGPALFTITPGGGTYSLTCTNTLITLNVTPTNYTYSWVSVTNPSIAGTSASFSSANQGTYVVTATNTLGACTSTQLVVITENTIAPTNSVNPTSQAITCASNSAVTFTGTVSSPTINVQHDWYSPLNPLPGGVPIATTNNTISILSGAIPPGTYTLVTTNLLNGCTTQKTITITSLSAFPTFSVSSPTNYSVGCAPLNQTTINIINPQSTQTPSPATCSFTFLPPGFAGVVTPSVVLGGNTSTITQLPGTWTVIVQDNSNFCRTILSVPVVQNTFAPNVSATILQQTLTCYHPTLLATGTSSTPNTVVTWGIPVAPNQLSTPTVEVGPANGPNTSSTSLTYANYTVIATNTINACITTSVMVINQNFKPPVSSPTISIGTPTAIYCNVSTNPAILTTGASTTTSGGGPLAYAIPYLWQGPSPQTTISGTSSYSAYVSGIYTLTIQDNYNGCLKTGTVNVLDKTGPPVLVSPVTTSTLDCGNNKATLTPAVVGGNANHLFYYRSYPAGAAFSSINAIILPGTPSSSLTVSLPGEYVFIVTNTLTGCKANGTITVVDGDLKADFDPNVVTGYAPLTVSFNNTSASSLGTGSITSVWSFGNGTSQTTTANISTSASYNAPGTYTVMLLASKGSCLDTVYKIIKVDVPSKLETPNVFTPNGDGSNDVFFLKTTNLGEITAIIFDRWGNKVYDVASSTGNIAWDGKNLQGKECAEGVYFYVIKASGKDGKSYETKGNVTLFR